MQWRAVVHVYCEGRTRLSTSNASEQFSASDTCVGVRRDVMPVLKGTSHTSAQARDELRAWFTDARREVQAAYDSETDFRFLLDTRDP
ncbi:hypothetical protein PTKU46_82110 [Paraburkholderia terrae]